MSGTSTIHAEQGVTPGHHGSNSNVTPGEIAIGVVIGRASEYFDFFCVCNCLGVGVSCGVFPV